MSGPPPVLGVVDPDVAGAVVLLLAVLLLAVLELVVAVVEPAPGPAAMPIDAISQTLVLTLAG